MRRTCYFSGNVQGVGFRYTAHNLAQQYEVAGYVRNLPDGRVELVMEGRPEQLDALMEDINERMGGFIHRATVAESPGTGEFADFGVRY